METDKIILEILHVLSAVTIFAATATVSSALRRGRKAGKAAYLAAIDGVCSQTTIGSLAALVALGTGLTLMLGWLGGMAEAPKNYHAALGLILIMIANGFLFFGPAARKLREIVEADGDGDAAERQRKRVIMAHMAQHTLWTIVLVLMFVMF